MNRIFSIVWNEMIQAFVVVSEHAKRRGKRGGTRSSVDEGEAPKKAALGIFALEPRVMFDAAAMVTAEIAIIAADHNVEAAAPTPIESAPVEVPVIETPVTVTNRDDQVLSDAQTSSASDEPVPVPWDAPRSTQANVSIDDAATVTSLDDSLGESDG
ncbi:MAG: LEPR-XLL domain-containing protein, partial [Moraxellaceae bacterium]